MSDISDELDYIEEDAHLINYGLLEEDHENELEEEDGGDNTKLLSLDEIPFDRDIR